MNGSRSRSEPSVPEVDARAGHDEFDGAVAAFRESGLLLVRGLLGVEELAALQSETAALVDETPARHAAGVADYCVDASGLPYRVEYVVDKSVACAAVAGHPRLLSLAAAIVGDDFVPTWDSLVFKAPGGGAPIAWHRDIKASEAAWEPARRAVVCNFGIYLDDSDEQTCLWAIPGSRDWGDGEAARAVAAATVDEFAALGGVAVPVRAGDALVHDVLVLHGSAPSRAGLRRVLYYEYRPAQVEREFGPHREEYVERKFAVLDACIAQRVKQPYAAGEQPFRPTGTRPVPRSLRFAHADWWRGYQPA